MEEDFGENTEAIFDPVNDTEETEFIDLDIEYEKNSIPLSTLIPKGMTIKEYFSKEQRLLRGENISYVKFDKDGYQ